MTQYSLSSIRIRILCESELGQEHSSQHDFLTCPIIHQIYVPGCYSRIKVKAAMSDLTLHLGIPIMHCSL